MKKNNFNDTFWIEGNGKDFLKWSGIEPHPGKFSTALFTTYDEKVDSLVAKWISKGEFSSIMNFQHHGTQENIPDDFLALKKEVEVIPDWVDGTLIKLGSELATRSGSMGLLVLRNFALLGGYNFANLTKPLVATGSLDKSVVHRLYNTLNFWVNVSRLGADSQEKRINACLTTRLVHAASRLMIQKKLPNWDREKYGVPINHADMVATNIAFTVYYLFGLHQLNFKYSENEEKGIFHLWKYVTYLLGVPVDIIPNNRIEALSYFQFWTGYQNKPDEDSLTLALSLLNDNTPVDMVKLGIVKRNMDYIHKSVANYLLDPQIRKNLEIPQVRFKSIIPMAIKLKNSLPLNREHQIMNGNTEQINVLKDYKNNM